MGSASGVAVVAYRTNYAVSLLSRVSPPIAHRVDEQRARALCNASPIDGRVWAFIESDVASRLPLCAACTRIDEARMRRRA